MDFNYVDFMSSSDKKLIKKLYYESFDKDERFPFWLLKKCSKEKNVKFNVIYNKDPKFQVETGILNKKV